MKPSNQFKLSISTADNLDREAIYKLRHEVYAIKLKQFDLRTDGSLPDSQEIESDFIVAKRGSKLAGFIGITPPTSPKFSIDKYLKRDKIPMTIDKRFYEIRALTV